MSPSRYLRAQPEEIERIESTWFLLRQTLHGLVDVEEGEVVDPAEVAHFGRAVFLSLLGY